MAVPPPRCLPEDVQFTARRLGVIPTRFILSVSVAAQKLWLWERVAKNGQRWNAALPESYPVEYHLQKSYVISTSAFGVGQRENSNCTPLGLHRIARKIGGGYPVGTVFRGRQPIGYTWEGLPKASIVHRILWLEGLEPGFNRGGNVDSFRRYIYIHGFGDETTLGRPMSHGCIHVAARDLIPLYDLLPVGTLVWVAESNAD